MTEKPDQKEISTIKKMLENIEQNLTSVKTLIADIEGEKSTVKASPKLDYDELLDTAVVSNNIDERIIEGVFDGQNMIGEDGRKYLVPANYASKSKLVEGDILKLTITSDGSFIFKQIKPIDRDRLIGVLVKDKEIDEFWVVADKRSYKVLLASITYFKGNDGDEVIILVPKGKISTWAAVENIIKKVESEDLSSADIEGVDMT